MEREIHSGLRVNLNVALCAYLLLAVPVLGGQPTLEIRDNQAIVVRDGTETLRVPLQPRRLVKEYRESPEEYIEDTAFLVASCLVVMRDYHYLGPFCHTPGVSAVEIYTLNGKHKIYRDPQVIYHFHGPRYTDPSGDWGVILFEAEGDVSGYLFLRSDGTLEKHLVEEDLEWRGALAEPSFSKDGDLVFPDMKLKGVSVTLIIKPDGSFVLK